MSVTHQMGWRHVGLALLATACTDFDRVDRNICGNGIVEPDRQEDCDVAPVVDAEGVSYRCGAQGTAEQCRLVCNTEDRACPAGWACSLADGICRQPLGATYELSAAVELPPSARVASADLDGDERADLAVAGDVLADGIGRLSVQHFDADGQVDGEALRQPTPARLGVPLAIGPLGSVPAPGVANQSVLAGPTANPGLYALRGRSDRTILPAMVAQFGGLGSAATVFPAVKDNGSGTFGHRPLVAENFSARYHGGLIHFDYVVDGPVLYRSDYQIDDVLPTEQVTTGKLGSLWGSDRESMIMAIPGEAHVRVYGIYGLDPWPYDELSLPAGVVVPADGGSWLGDANGDGHLDLFVAGDDQNTYLAFGVGDRTFTSSLDSDEPDWATSTAPAIVGIHPIAVGPIDDDAYADFVFPASYGIALSNPDGAYAVTDFLIPCPQLSATLASSYICGTHAFEGGALTAATLPQWGQAQIVDLNLDGRLDVVAVARDAAAIDVFYTSQWNLLGHHRIHTPGPVGSAQINDANRDGVPDLLFDAQVGGHVAIMRSIGRLTGGMDPPALIFEAAVVDQIRGEWGGGLLILGRDRDDQAVLSVAQVASAEGVPVPSSQIMCPSPDGQPETYQQLATGRFDDRPGYDAALLYRDCFRPSGATPADQLVLYPAGEMGRLDPVLDTPMDGQACPWTAGVLGCKQNVDALHPTSVELAVDPSWSSDALIVPIDLNPADGEDRDELVLIAPEGDGSEVAVFELDPAPPGLPRFKLRQRLTLGVQAGGTYELGWRGKAETVDADGDGDLDILLLTTGPQPALRLLTNDAGKLAATVSPVALPPEVKGEKRSFTVFDADYDLQADDLLVAAGADVYLVINAFTAARARKIEVTKWLTIEIEAIDDVLAADFNGDGLTDVAVVRESKVHLLRSLPANP